MDRFVGSIKDDPLHPEFQEFEAPGTKLLERPSGGGGGKRPNQPGLKGDPKTIVTKRPGRWASQTGVDGKPRGERGSIAARQPSRPVRSHPTLTASRVTFSRARTDCVSSGSNGNGFRESVPARAAS